VSAKNGPAFRRDLAGFAAPLAHQVRSLDLLLILAALAALLAGPVALALRILLQLAGFLAATLLTGVLALLAGILVLLVRHSGNSLVGRQ
jgi:hypothetical protein